MIKIKYYNNNLIFLSNNILFDIPHQTCALLLENANEELEKDLNNWTSQIKDINNAHLTWAVTWNELRIDDLEGVILYYYIFEVIGFLIEKHPNKSIVIEGDLISGLQNLWNNKGFKNKVIWKTKLSLKAHIRTSISPVKLIAPFFKLKKYNKGIKKNEVWFSSGLDVSRNRLRNIPDFFLEYSRIFFYQHYTRHLKKSGFGESLNFAENRRFVDLISAFGQVRLLRKKIKFLKYKGIIGLAIKNLSFQQMMGMKLKEIWVERELFKRKPKAIFFATANTYSPARLLSRLAFIHEIPFYIVACRPMFTKLRSEERATLADLNNVNGASVCSAHIVWDEFSKKTLVEQGFMKEKVFVLQNKINFLKSTKLELSNGFMILFTHDKKFNDKMLSELSICNLEGPWWYRVHPNKKLTKNQVIQLNTILPNSIDISKTPMNNIQFDSIVVISINSTAAVEAASYGAGILWIPYLNFKSVIFEPVMTILGSIATNSQLLNKEINYLKSLDNKKELVTSCKKAYETFFKSKEKTLDFDEIIKINIK